MYFSSQKKKIISLVLVFGCIYAVNACAHPLGQLASFNILNHAPNDKPNLGQITISSKLITPSPCRNSSGKLFSIDISPSRVEHITIYTDYHGTCNADIQYGKDATNTTHVKIKWGAAAQTKSSDAVYSVVQSITTENGGPLGGDDDKAFNTWRGIIKDATQNKVTMNVVPLTMDNDTLSYTQK